MLLKASAPARASVLAEPRPRLADINGPAKTSFITPSVLGGFARLFDLVCATASGIAVALAYIPEPGTVWSMPYLLVIAATSLLAVLIFEGLGLYSTWNAPALLQKLPRFAMGWALAFGCLETALFFLKYGAEVSRGWVGLWFATGFVMLAMARLLLARRLMQWAREGRLNRRAVIYGAGDVSIDVIHQLEADAGVDIRIAGIFDDRAGLRTPASIGGYPHLGGLDALVNFCRSTRVDLVIVALPFAAEQRLSTVVRQLSVLPADVKLPAKATAIRFSPRTYSHVGTIAMIDLYDKPITGWGTVVKWAFDKLVAGMALVLLAPVMLGIAAAIKIDTKGPVFFRQKRYGFNNELIEVWKFRSMYSEKCDADARRLVTRNDSRVTRVGRFIRRTSLDELPQLFNVVGGELSLVGPRPHALEAKAADQLYDAVVDGYFARHKVKPGITGWAQINGWRGETDTPEKIEKRVEHDLYYIENWSLLLDLYILTQTPASLFKSDQAY
ncbi:MAG: undecaprenyl-phosphate glucose phosphotransferase [Hyphomicrobium sp.]